MVPNAISWFLARLRQSPQMQEGPEQTDAQLLEAFLERGDAGALEALVRRHAPMVWGVCRRTLANHHDAADAFQATFLVLVRRAPSIRARELLANWLYGVAQKTACKARQMAVKRSTREQQMGTMPEPQAVESRDCAFGPDVLRLLDKELSRLPEKYRAPIVLCYLERKTRAEAARQLHVPEGTVGSRLARGRAMLAQRLARHGVSVSATTVAAVLSPRASAALPDALLTRTIKAVGLLAAGQTVTAGLLSTKAPPLTDAVLRAMAAPKWKAAAVVLLLAGLALGGGMVAYHSPASPPSRPKQPPETHDVSRAGPDPKKYGTRAGARKFAKTYLHDKLRPGSFLNTPPLAYPWGFWPSRDFDAKFDPTTHQWTVTGAYRLDLSPGMPYDTGRFAWGRPIEDFSKGWSSMERDWKLVLSYNPSTRAYGVQKAERFQWQDDGGRYGGGVEGYRAARKDDFAKWLQGKFMKPRSSRAPITALRLVLDVPEPTMLGLKPSYSYGKNDMAVESSPRGVSVSIDDHGAGRQVKQWVLQFGAPLEQSLKVGEYGGACAGKQAGLGEKPPGPLIGVSRWLLDGGKRTLDGNWRDGKGWACGEFVVREIELQDQKVVRLAIDFITDTEYGLPSTAECDSRLILRGSLRFHSRLQPSVPRLDVDASE
jgi:RNA polymerase sigma factor (sigma-70 family)